ncbi:MAG: CocE/NonD family hydrolase [Lentisphaerae bacterium]|nr:CocE/NonD family hydrolase [Lentisphaerota bacterium]
MQALIFRKVPMSDGILLATDVWLPNGPGPWPVVFVRTPYHRQGGGGAGQYFTDRGYAYVVQDARGKYDSDGVFRALDHEADDGQASLDWIANQRWCNGRIGMVGRSYLGIVQIPAAAAGHEALRCISPGVSPNSFFVDWIRYDGCFALANMIRWPLTHDVCPTKPADKHFSWPELWEIAARGTLKDVEDRIGFVSAQLRNWVDRDQYDDYWASIDQALLYRKIACPGLHQGGYFDHLSRGQFNSFREISANGATPNACANQRLLVGPWGHSCCGAMEYGDWTFGPAAGIDLSAYQQRFLDLWLRDIDDGITDEPPVKYFLMGENRWEEAPEWPPPGSSVDEWFLSSDGNAHGLAGGGLLSRETSSSGSADSYTYDPNDPVPTLGGQVYWGVSEQVKVGPAEQHPILDRGDVLYYRSDRLGEPLRVVGPVELDLWIQSSASDTDFIAKLCVVDHLGRVTALTVGSLRCRYRNSWCEPEPLSPGEPTRIRIQMNNLAYTFPAGSRLALIITSSCFPRILPHRNTMAPTWRETSAQTAVQDVLHAQGFESRLLLPVLSA